MMIINKHVTFLAVIMLFGLISCGGGSGSSTPVNDNLGNGNSPQSTQSLTLNWTAPTQNTDDSELTDLVNFKLYYGTDPDALDQSVLIGPLQSSYTLSNLPSNTDYYFVITAINSNDDESDRSNVVMKTTPG